jgi:predicted transglutaminase-like cysteine proteinase
LRSDPKIQGDPCNLPLLVFGVSHIRIIFVRLTRVVKVKFALSMSIHKVLAVHWDLSKLLHFRCLPIESLFVRGGAMHRPCLKWLMPLLLSLAVATAGYAWNRESVMAAARLKSVAAFSHVEKLLALISANADKPELAKLDAMNQFFNRGVRFQSDQEVWGMPDYWASPIEFLDRGQGDCEDYALAKYFTLIAMGVSPVKLRMVYVRVELAGQVQAHMVLAYYASPEADPLILDNLVTEVRPASRRPDLVPVFSFNAEGLWQGMGAASAGNPTARLSKWRNVLSRAKEEGWW